MDRRRFLGMGLGTLLVSGAAFQGKREHVRIGLVETMFRDIPENTVKTSIDQFREIMEKETGHTGESVTIKDYTDVADQLVKNKIQLAALHGFEFAWVRQKHQELRPLVVAINQKRYVQSSIMVQAGAAIRDFAGLKGQALAVPEATKEYNRFFLERLCRKAGEDVER